MLNLLNHVIITFYQLDCLYTVSSFSFCCSNACCFIHIIPTSFSVGQWDETYCCSRIYKVNAFYFKNSVTNCNGLVQFIILWYMHGKILFCCSKLQIPHLKLCQMTRILDQLPSVLRYSCLIYLWCLS